MQGKIYVLKITRFRYKLKALYIEIKAYSALKMYKFIFTLKFLGYIYKEIKSQVIGFLIEALNGHHLDIKDLEICKDAMLQLYTIKVVHRDLNKYNIVIKGKKAKFIDFEVATFQDNKNYVKLELEETIKLA